MPVFYVYLAILIVVVLVVIAGYLHIKLHIQSKRQEKHRQHTQIERAQMQDRTKKSVEVLCRTLLAEQVLVTEASIRISVLLSALDLHENEVQRYSAFTHLAKAVAHIPIMEDWRKLSRTQKQAYEKERDDLENQYRDFIFDAAQAYLNRVEVRGAANV